MVTGALVSLSAGGPLNGARRPAVLDWPVKSIRISPRMGSPQGRHRICARVVRDERLTRLLVGAELASRVVLAGLFLVARERYDAIRVAEGLEESGRTADGR